MPELTRNYNTAPVLLRTEALVSLWMLPFKVTQAMMEAGATMMGAALDRTRALAEEQIERTKALADEQIERGPKQTGKVAAAAEEQLGKLDDAGGDTAVNPAAPVS